MRLAGLLPAYGGALMAAARREHSEAQETATADARASMPVATGDQLRAVLGKAAGIGMWADVREVKTSG